MMYFSLFYMFFRTGLFGFGGGYAMLPLIFQSVQEFGVMTKEEFSNLVALSQITPGPVAVNAATYVGFNYAGLPGAVVATLGVTLPAFIIMLVVAKFLEKFNQSFFVKGAFAGIRPVTTGLVAAAAVMVAETSMFNTALFSREFIADIAANINIVPCVICVVTIILAGKFKFSPIAITLTMGVIGAFICG